MIVSGAKSCLTSEAKPSSEIRLSAKKAFVRVINSVCIILHKSFTSGNTQINIYIYQ